MVDDEILLPDGGEAIAAMVADAAGIARRIGHEFEVRPVEAGDLRHLVERQHAIDLEHAVIGGAERAQHEPLQLRRHHRLDVEPDHQPAAAPLERGLEQPHQIFGLFEDFQFQIADDAEGTHALHRIAREQLADEKAGLGLDRDQPHFAALPGLRQPHEPFDAVRHADQRVHRLAVLDARQLQGDREAEIGNERERMRRIDGERRQQREHMGKKMALEPGPLRLANIRTIDQRDAGLGECCAQLAPLCLLIFNENHHGVGNAHKLLGRGQSLGALRGDTGAHLGPQAGHAHHEELVEVVRRDRQEFQSLQQRMTAIGGFLEDAAVEIEPRQLTIDEAVRARGQSRRSVPLRRFGEPGRRFQSRRRAGFERNSGRLAAVDHDYSWVLEPHPRCPW